MQDQSAGWLLLDQSADRLLQDQYAGCLLQDQSAGRLLQDQSAVCPILSTIRSLRHSYVLQFPDTQHYQLVVK
jgi:hypothetical protein